MCLVLRLMHMLCVKDVLLKMSLYMHVKEICNSALCLYEQNYLEVFQGWVFSPCSARASCFVISMKINKTTQK